MNLNSAIGMEIPGGGCPKLPRNHPKIVLLVQNPPNLASDLIRKGSDITISEAEIIRKETDITISEAKIIRKEADITISETEIIRKGSDITISETEIIRKEAETTFCFPFVSESRKLSSCQDSSPSSDGPMSANPRCSIASSKNALRLCMTSPASRATA